MRARTMSMRIAAPVRARTAHGDQRFHVAHAQDGHGFLDRRQALARIVAARQDGAIDRLRIGHLLRLRIDFGDGPKHVDIGIVPAEALVLHEVEDLLHLAVAIEAEDSQAQCLALHLLHEIGGRLPAGLLLHAAIDRGLQLVETIGCEQIPEAALVLAAGRRRVVEILRRLPAGIETLQPVDLDAHTRPLVHGRVIAKRAFVRRRAIRTDDADAQAHRRAGLLGRCRNGVAAAQRGRFARRRLQAVDRSLRIASALPGVDQISIAGARRAGERED
jgi:hypothetical protein